MTCNEKYLLRYLPKVMWEEDHELNEILALGEGVKDKMLIAC